MRIIRLISLILASLTLASMLGAAPPPTEWGPGDYPSEPPRWWGVEIARFPSAILAEGIESSLKKDGWGPVTLREDPKTGDTSVILGEVDNLGQAWYLAEELKAQRLAEGRIVPLETGGQPRAFAGPLLPPFVVDFETDPEKRNELSEELRSQLEALVREVDSEDVLRIENMLAAIDQGNLQDPAVGRGAAEAARLLFERQAAPESALFLSSRVASGEWPVGPDDEEMRRNTREITFELLYGHRRDFRGAWLAAREMERTAEDIAERKSLNRLRQASLLVDLIDQKREPRPTFARVRQELRRAYEMAPADSRQLKSRIELVYLQTFAWEGRWDRVEELGEAMSPRYSEQNAYAALARVYYAQSFERTREYQRAIEILNGVASSRIPPDRYLTFGVQTLDPATVAMEKRKYFFDLAILDKEPVGPEEQEPVPTPLPRREPERVPDVPMPDAEAAEFVPMGQ